jgi:peptidoglycan/xylan/chitin deacetylase (PgdA/CDA1 family)
MKKNIFFISTFFLTLGLSLFHSTSVEASSAKYFEVIKEQTPIYDNRRDAEEGLKVVGYLQKGQQFTIASDYGKNWWKINYGDSYGYIYKPNVKTIEKITYKNKNKGEKNLKQHILTIKNMTVYDNTSGKLVPFAMIKANLRYPIISEFGSNWYKVDVNGRIGYIGKTGTQQDNGIPVLMYHHLLKKSENTGEFKNASTTITPEQFQEQMDYLHKQGYETLYPKELEAYVQQKINLPAKSVLVTFDDGLKSTHVYAYPILKKYNQKATNFIITERIPSKPVPFNPESLQFLSIQEMNNTKDAFNYESHTNSMHGFQSNVPLLITNNASAITSDIKKSITALNPINNNVHYFAYPFGQYDKEAINAVKASGITMAFTTKPGLVKTGDNPLELKRIYVVPKMTMTEFIKSLSN